VLELNWISKTSSNHLQVKQ